MEVDLSPATLKLIKKLVREEFNRIINDTDDWVSTEEAAKILGYKSFYLRRIKDRYVWRQDKERGKLLFKRSSLIVSSNRLKD